MSNAPLPSNRGISEGSCATDEKKPAFACEQIKSHLSGYRSAFKDDDACGVEEEGADSVATRRLVEKHLGYIRGLEAQNKAVPEECCRCFEQLLENSKSAKKPDQSLAGNPANRRSPTGANTSTSAASDQSCSQSTVCERDAHSSNSSSSGSKRCVSVTVTEVCENHKRFLARTAELVDRLKPAGSKESCEVCKLVKELYDTGCHENSAFSLRFEDTAIPADLFESGAQAPRPNRSLKPESNRFESCAKAAPSTADAAHHLGKKSPTAAEGPTEMPKYRCEYDNADDGKALGAGSRAAGRPKTVCCRCEFHHNEHDSEEDDAGSPPGRTDERNRWPPGRKRKEPRPAVDVCSKCGGEMEADEPMMKDEYPRRPNLRSDITTTASNQKFVKRTRNQKDFSSGQQRALRESPKTVACTCTAEEEENVGRVGSTRSPNKSNDRCCAICGGVNEVEESVSPRKPKRSEAEMNEAIMAKRAQVWGENVPPDFIINDTDYAKRHADCCVNKGGAVRSARYACPKGAQQANVGEDDNDEDDDVVELGLPKAGFSVECVVSRPAERKPSRSQERRCNRPSSDRPAKEKCQPKGPTKRHDSQRPRKNPGDSSPLAQREGADPCKGQNKEPSDARLTAIDSNGSIVSYTCKLTKSDEDASDEDATFDVYGSSCDATSASWFEKLNKQIRSYIDIDYDSDEELVVCEQPSSDDPRFDDQSPVITWVLALPPRQASRKKTQSCRDPSKPTTRSRRGSQEDARCAKDKQAARQTAPSGPNDPSRSQQCKQTQTSKESVGPIGANPSRISFDSKVQIDSTPPTAFTSCVCAKNRDDVPSTSARADPDDAACSTPMPAPPSEPDNCGPLATGSSSQTGIVLSVETARQDGPDKEEDNSRISIRISSLKRTSQDNDADRPACSPEETDAEPPHKQTQTSISVRRRQHINDTPNANSPPTRTVERRPMSDP